MCPASTLYQYEVNNKTNLNVTGESVQHRLDVINATEVSEDSVGEVKCDSNGTKVKRHEHIPHMVHLRHGL